MQAANERQDFELGLLRPYAPLVVPRLLEYVYGESDTNDVEDNIKVEENGLKDGKDGTKDEGDDAKDNEDDVNDGEDEINNKNDTKGGKDDTKDMALEISA